jgi:hypothetical protein
LDEREYWSALEYRVTRELAGMPRKGRGALWCDGFAPAAYWLTEDPPRIEGDAWIGYDGQDVWRFTLFLPKAVASREAIDWDALLPPDDETYWLAIDESRKIIQVDPGTAVPDLDS